MTAQDRDALQRLTESVNDLRHEMRDIKTAIIGDLEHPDRPGVMDQQRLCRADRQKIWVVVKVLWGVLFAVLGWIVYGKI